jgi:integrase
LANLLPGPGKIRRVEHFGAMPYSEIGAFMTLLRQQTSIPARALEFLILTAARTGEVLGARWREINISDRIWSIPGERMKAGREHRVPLSDAAMAILEMVAAIRQNDLVFPGINVGRLLAHDVMSRELHRLGSQETVHGFRSAFRDWAAETTAYPSEVAEQALGHAVGSAVERAYRRTDLFNRRRRLMDEWARFCELPVPTGEVVPLRG